MNKIEFEIRDDVIVRYAPILGRPNLVKEEIVMDKQTFIEAYKKWILEEDK